MGANVWPANAVSSSPTYQGRALRQTSVAPSFAGASAARPAGAFSGVRPGTSNAIVTATTTTWTVTPFGGVIDAESSNVAGPYGYFFDTNQTGSLTAAAGSTRLDRLDVQVSDPAEDGTGAVAIAIIKTDGVAGSGVTAAAPVRSHPLAVISVPSAGSPTIIWAATYCVAAGGVLPVLTFALLPASAGQIGQRAEVFADTTVTNNLIYRWNGTVWKAWESDWITYTATLAGFAVGTGGSALALTRYRYVAGMVEVAWKFIFGTAGTTFPSTPTFTLPVNQAALAHTFMMLPSAGDIFDLSATRPIESGLITDTTSVSAVRIWYRRLTATDGFDYPVSGSALPFIFAAGDVMQGRATFEPA